MAVCSLIVARVLLGYLLLANPADSRRIATKVAQPEKPESSSKGWLSSMIPDAPECSKVISSFTQTPRALIGHVKELMSWMNPFRWVSHFGNVMDISDENDDLEELDMRVSSNAASKRCTLDFQNDTCALDASVLAENLRVLDPALVVKIWLRRIHEVGFTHHEFTQWLDAEFGGKTEPQQRIPGLHEFLTALIEVLPPGSAKKRLMLTRGDVSLQESPPSILPAAPQKGETLKPIHVAFEEDGRTLAVRSGTSMFDDPYWRRQLLNAMWPHADHVGGYMIRTAMGKVGRSPGDQQVEGQSIEENRKLMEQNTAFNAYSDKPVVAWAELDGELMQKLWDEASAHFRELSGVDPDAEYIVAFTLRGMKAGGLLDRSGKGLPGAIWHKDVFADHVTIIYPFCFLAGYDNEVSSRSEYEKSDPGSAHLAKFMDPVENTVLVATVPEGAEKGFGESITFNNDQTRHRALVPLHATREAVEQARMEAKNWGVPDNAVRAMIHITIRKKSWTDLVEQLAFKIPSAVGTFFGPLVKCLQQAPMLEQWWFNTYGGFIDRNDRKM